MYMPRITSIGRYLQRVFFAVTNNAIVLPKSEYPNLRFHWSQCAEDIVIDSIIGSDQTGYYVDVGAHHPSSLSNTMSLYKRGWTGINIDPNPDLFENFLKERLKDTNLNVGISNEVGLLTYYMFECPLLNTLDENKAETWKQHSKLVDVRTVPCTTLALVLNEYLPDGVTIDLLSVDVEGHEVAVLLSNDWSRFRPKLVVVEQLLRLPFLDIATSEIYVMMHSNQYECVGIVGHSQFYLRSDLMGEYSSRELA